MLKLIVGVKGTGKTKNLINMVNEAFEKSSGSVICIEKGQKLRYDIKYHVRLIDTEEYLISDAHSLFGFIAGISASNHDITDIFVDSALKICGNDMKSFENCVALSAKFAEKNNINVVMTISADPSEISEEMKKYLA